MESYLVQLVCLEIKLTEELIKLDANLILQGTSIKKLKKF